MPVAGMTMSERPLNSVQCDTVCYLSSFVNVIRVIKINEFMSERLTKNDPGERHQKNANAKNQVKAPVCPVPPRDGRHRVALKLVIFWGGHHRANYSSKP